MKENFKKWLAGYKEGFSAFMDRNGKAITGAVLLAVFNIVGREMGFIKNEEPPKPKNIDLNNDLHHLPGASNPIEVAIAGIWKTGGTAFSDAQKLAAANRISDILVKNPVDASTLSYGIRAITKIGQKVYSDSNKNRIDELISALAVNVKPVIDVEPEPVNDAED